MKAFLLILFIKLIIQSSCNNDNSAHYYGYSEEDPFFLENYDLINITKWPFKSLLLYNRMRGRVKNYLDTKSAELNCDIKDFCASSCNKLVADFKNLDLFCELFYEFEHEKMFVFYINYVELWFLTSKNYTIDSEQIFGNSNNNILDARLVKSLNKF